MGTYSCGLFKTISLVTSKHFITFSITSKLTCFDWYKIKRYVSDGIQILCSIFPAPPYASPSTLCLFQQ